MRDGYALPLGDALVYGTAPGGAVAQLCIHGVPDDVVGLLHAIALKHHLVLVEWCAARARAPTTPASSRSLPAA